MKRFLRDMLERAVKTAAQSAAAIIGSCAVISEIDWMLVLSGTGVAMLLSVLTSVASRGFGDHDSAGLVDGE